MQSDMSGIKVITLSGFNCINENHKMIGFPTIHRTTTRKLLIKDSF